MRALIAGAASGLLYTWSIPDTDIGWLAWVALIPVLVVRSREPLWPNVRRLGLGRLSRVFAAAVVVGTVSSIARVYWIAETLTRFGGVPFLPAFLTNALLVLYMSVYPICFFLICARLPVESLRFPWIAASIWVLFEWTQTWMISGFPWQLYGYSQYDNLHLVQISSLVGVFGLSFLLVAANAALTQLILLRRSPLRILSPHLLLLGLGTLYGYQRLDDTAAGSSSPLKTAIVQGNVVQSEKWEPRFLQRTVEQYVDLTRKLAAGKDLDLIVYPETALPMHFRSPGNAAFRDRISELGQELETPMLVGSLDRSESQSELPPKSFNRAFLLDATGQIVDYADKVHLVPFGEYLPFPSIFKYLGGLTAQSGHFEAGESHRSLGITDESSLGIFVCFESVFPEITRTLVLQGATILVNTTNDAWFGRTAAPYQHFSMSIVRAVETGRPVIRAANTGISGLISNRGRVLESTGLFETKAFVVDVYPSTEITPYVRHGDLLVGGAALFLSGIFVRMLWINRGAESVGRSD